METRKIRGYFKTTNQQQTFLIPSNFEENSNFEDIIAKQIVHSPSFFKLLQSEFCKNSKYFLKSGLKTICPYTMHRLRNVLFLKLLLI